MSDQPAGISDRPARAPASAALRPIELATGAVLGGATVGLVTIGSVIPFAAALQLVAAVPMGLLAQRYRFRALVTASVSAALVTFVAGGLAAAIAMAATATIGGIVGGVKRRRRGLVVVTGLSVAAGLAWGAFSIAYLAVFSATRALIFDNIRNSATGLADLTARQAQLAPLGRGVLNTAEIVLQWWWIYIGATVALGTVVTALVSWFVLGSVLDRLTWLPGTDRLDAPADDRPIAPLPVVLRNVGYRYPGATDNALAGIDLRVEVGEFVAVVGHNGSGKSTLTRLLAGLPPSTGVVERPGSAGLGQLGGTALVLQRPESQTLGVLVADDVVWGLPAEVASEVPIDDLLREVGLDGMSDRETATLSGGQQQRLAVAAALARQPALLIADEATSMIDPDGRRELVALLAELPKRHPMAVLLVTHHEADAAAADRVIHLTDGRMADHLPAWPKPVRAQRRAPLGEPILELHGVRHTYNRGTPWEAQALHGIDLTVRRGEALLVVGGNGSGKSTLAWIMAGLITPSTGRCELAGKPVGKQIGRVELAFQHSRLQLQRHTVGEEISDWGGNGTGSGTVGKALDAVGLDRSLTTRSIEELSGGQAKRVVLAAIVAAHPHVVVLDEPLAGLDPEGRADIVDLLARLRNSGLTLIVISHDVEDVAAICDRTVHLQAGRIPETETAQIPAPEPEADTAPIPPVRQPGQVHRPTPDAAWRLRGDAHGGAR